MVLGPPASACSFGIPPPSSPLAQGATCARPDCCFLSLSGCFCPLLSLLLSSYGSSFLGIGQTPDPSAECGRPLHPSPPVWLAGRLIRCLQRPAAGSARFPPNILRLGGCWS